MEFYKPTWVDLAIVAVLIAGMIRGRKRGMSEELIDVFKWLIIIVSSAYLYEPMGGFLASMTPFSLLSCYVTVYLAIVGGIIGLFSLFKRAVGSKLVESDCFGGGEYYLGMFAGGLRFACITLVVLSLLNARYYSPQEIEAKRRYHMNNYGMMLFAYFEVQADVFQRSFLGRAAGDYLSLVMIRPTAPQDKGLGQNRRAVRARERTFNEILD